MIHSIYLKNFRNFSDILFSPPDGISILTGENGTGKTSLLEGIYFASRFESFRTSDDRDMIREGTQGFFIRCECRSTMIEIGYNGSRKKVKKNGVFYRSYFPLIGEIPVVIFLPEDIFLVSGAPEIKRRFLDTTMGIISYEYREVLKEYRQALKHRNNVIKKIREGIENRDSLNIWNRMLSEKGSFLIQKRENFINSLLPIVREIFGRFSDRKIDLRYVNHSGIGEEYLKKLELNLDKELAAGYTLYGPHRDSIEILMDGVEATSYASYGYQRLIAFSLRIAETEIIKREKEQTPVVLVDEVINELDNRNRKIFLQVLENYPQTIIATVTSSFANFEKCSIFKLEKVNEATEIGRIT